jgi:hypothetical protein
MDYTISESVANYVLSEDIQPININDEFIQFREKLEKELSFSKQKMKELYILILKLRKLMTY